MELNSRRKLALAAIFGLISIAIVLTFMAPEEQTLGDYIRLIYVHAAVTWVGMAMFVITGILAAAYFAGFAFKGRSGWQLRSMMDRWSSNGLVTGIMFWTASVIMGGFAATLTWGGNWWIEPRLRVAAYILALGIIIYQIREMVANQTLRVALNLSFPLSAFLLLAGTGKLVHPNNAFSRSESIEIKLFALAITLVFAIVAFIVTMLLVQRAKDKATRARDDEQRLAVAES